MKLLIPVFLLLFIVSCNKEETKKEYITISGKVINVITGQPVANAMISLDLVTGTKTYTPCYTSQNGEYSFIMEKGEYTYDMFPNSLRFVGDPSVYEFKTTSNINHDIYGYQQRRIFIYFKSTSGTPADSIDFSHQRAIPSHIAGSIGPGILYPSGAVHFLTDLYLATNVKHYYNLTVYKNGGAAQIKDSVIYSSIFSDLRDTIPY